MSSAGRRKTGIKQLRNLLRAMSHKGAYMMRLHDNEQYRVFTNTKNNEQSIMEPDHLLISHVFDQDLLTKRNGRWVIGPNGRLALKRMLAGADPFAEQHQVRKMRQRKIDGDNCTVVVNDRSSPLGWLAKRKDASGEPMISKLQFTAGERLAQDFQFAGLMPRITASWSGPGIGGQKRGAPGMGIELSDNRLAARQRVRAAIDEVGCDLCDILLDICCFQLGLSEAEKTRGWPRRSGKLILQIALDRLAKHYGMSQPRQGQRRSVDHWGGEGYKPSS